METERGKSGKKSQGNQCLMRNKKEKQKKTQVRKEVVTGETGREKKKEGNPPPMKRGRASVKHSCLPLVLASLAQW